MEEIEFAELPVTENETLGQITNSNIDLTVADIAAAVNISTETLVPERAKWSKKFDFILSAVGYAVGFGNVWRFPYLCYSNGGGVFLIPYFIMMVFAGLPLFYLELALGQFASLGPITIWRVCPLFKGLGYTMMGLNVMVSVYYNVILALSIFYLIASFTSNLPWANCGKIWNRNCLLTHNIPSAIKKNTSLVNAFTTPDAFNNSNISSDYLTTQHVTISFSSTKSSGILDSVASHMNNTKSPAEEYWLYYVLGVDDSTNISHIGDVRWHLTLCHLLAWIIVLLCIIRGIKTSGKVVYFTATFPYVVLFILFVRGVTLPGAWEGIKFYLIPDFSKMASVKVWNDAAIQILFSLGPGFGSLIMLGSYNNFHNRCDRDAVIVTLINCFTSVFAGFVIFSVLGFMSVRRGLAVDQVVDKGPGLAFIAYPEALSMMPGAPFWSICFFFMLFTLGLDSQFVGVESIITGLMDEFPIVARWKKTSTVILCLILFLSGLPCVTQGAMYVVELIDQFTTSFPLLIVTLLEVIVIAWIYGIRKFSKDIETMLGYKPNYYWLSCWIVITPLIILFILIFKSVEYKGLYFGQYRYPPWAEGIGWLIVASLIGVIPFVGVAKFFQCIGSLQNFWWVITGAVSIDLWKLHQLWRPSPKWKPAEVKVSESSNEEIKYKNSLNRKEGQSSSAVELTGSLPSTLNNMGPSVYYKADRCIVTTDLNTGHATSKDVKPVSETSSSDALKKSKLGYFKEECSNDFNTFNDNLYTSNYPNLGLIENNDQLEANHLTFSDSFQDPYLLQASAFDNAKLSSNVIFPPTGFPNNDKNNRGNRLLPLDEISDSHI